MHFCCSKFFFLDLIRGTLHKSEFKIIITYVMLAFDVATLPSRLQAHLKVFLLGCPLYPTAKHSFVLTARILCLKWPYYRDLLSVMSYDTKHLQQSEAWAFFSYVYVLVLVFEPSAAFDLSIHHFYSIIHVTYTTCTLNFIWCTLLLPGWTPIWLQICLAFLWHRYITVLHSCCRFVTLHGNFPSHRIPEVLNWIQMWWLWRPFECSELTVGRLWLRSSTNRKVRSLAA